MSAPRTALLAKMHIARKDLALEEDSYRALLSRVTGCASAADCTDAQLETALAEFRRLGWTPKAKRRPLSTKPHVRKVFALWGAMKPFLRNGTTKALCAFVERQTGVSDPEWLSPEEATKVVEALKAWARRLKMGGST
jgi:phage gp16-like protein